MLPVTSGKFNPPLPKNGQKKDGKQELSRQVGGRLYVRECKRQTCLSCVWSEMKRSLISWQTMFTKAKSQSEAAVKASFIAVAEIAKSARPFNEGEFVKKCPIKVCDVMCPDKRQAFLNVSLSRNTVADRACELSTNLHEWLMEKGKDFIAYSLAVGESSNTSDTVQLSIFIHGVDSSRCITEELLWLKSMHGTTTGKEIFEEVSKCVTEMKLPWDKLVGLTMDGAPTKCDQKSGLVGRIREKMWQNHAGELTVYHCIIHQESLWGKALKMEHGMTTTTRVVNLIRAKVWITASSSLFWRRLVRNTKTCHITQRWDG